jgi:hypothetical protein
VYACSACRSGKNWDQAALRDHVQPLLDAAAEELQAAASIGGAPDAAGSSDAGSSGPAVCLVLTLAKFQANPWQLGCHVPEPLARLLWGSYCSHLIESAQGDDSKLLTTDGGAERLAAAANEGLAAAPSATHVMLLATKLAQQLMRCCLDTELQARAAEAALAAARSLAAGAQDGAAGGEHQAERGLLVAALAAAAWQLNEEAEAEVEAASGTRREALALLRRCLHSPGSLVPLLLDQECCTYLRSEALGSQETELEMISHWEVYGRGCVAAGARQGRRGRRLAVDPSFLHC